MKAFNLEIYIASMILDIVGAFLIMRRKNSSKLNKKGSWTLFLQKFVHQKGQV